VRRTKTITHPGTAQSPSLVTEIWYSADLKELVEMRQIPDPKFAQAGVLTDFQLTDIRRTEPDPALFYPPPGYDIHPYIQPAP
jgi:hypothetical protein